MGRPTKLSPELQAAIVKAIADGVPGSVAAQAHGVGARTFYQWLRAGRDEKSEEYSQFAHAVTHARSKSEARLVGIISNAKTKDGDPDWHAAAWLLERRIPMRYARKDKPELTVKNAMERAAKRTNEETIAELRELIAQLEDETKQTH